MIRFSIGALLAAAVALMARRAGLLSSSGSIAATVIGAIAVAAGWSWTVLLIAYFVSSVALTRFRGSAKAARVGAIVAKGAARDAVQVIANGGAFAAAALLWIATGWEGWRALGGGSLAVAASDTWATEIGTLATSAPRSIVTGRPVPAGTSGGISLLGVGAATAGSLFVALLALALGWPAETALAAFAAGIGGSTIDSLLGATVQERRWCGRCNGPTERTVHGCGTKTRVVGGVPAFDNDVVNAVSTLAGGLLALAVAI